MITKAEVERLGDGSYSLFYITSDLMPRVEKFDTFDEAVTALQALEARDGQDDGQTEATE